MFFKRISEWNWQYSHYFLVYIMTSFWQISFGFSPHLWFLFGIWAPAATWKMWQSLLSLSFGPPSSGFGGCLRVKKYQKMWWILFLCFSVDYFILFFQFLKHILIIIANFSSWNGFQLTLFFLWRNSYQESLFLEDYTLPS